MSAPISTSASKPMITDVFVAGARKGWNIATTSTLPNVLMAFVLIKALEITGALKGMALVFGPLMGLFGLPGEAAAVLIGGWMSMGGGVGVAVALFDRYPHRDPSGDSGAGHLPDGLPDPVCRAYPRRYWHRRQTYSGDDRHLRHQRLHRHAAHARNSVTQGEIG